MVDEDAVDMAAGSTQGRWCLLTSMISRQCGLEEMFRLVFNHWSVENSLHQVKDRSWDEYIQTLRKRDGFQSRCRCPCEARNAPAAHWRPLPASMDELFSVASSWGLGWL